MAKQAKMKKGSIGKKALAAILAASMVLSSSAFSVLASVSVPGDGDVTVPDEGIATASLNEDNGIATAKLEKGQILLGFEENNVPLPGAPTNIVFDNTEHKPKVVVVHCMDTTHKNIAQCYEAALEAGEGWSDPKSTSCHLIDRSKVYYSVAYGGDLKNAAKGWHNPDPDKKDIIQARGPEAEAKFAAEGPYVCVKFGNNQQEGDEGTEQYEDLGNYYISFEIKPLDLDDVPTAVTKLQYGHTYNGKVNYPGMDGFSVTLNGKPLDLIEGRDYVPVNAKDENSIEGLISASELTKGDSGEPFEDKQVWLRGINGAEVDLDGDGNNETGNYKGTLGDEHYDGAVDVAERYIDGYGYDEDNKYPNSVSKTNDFKIVYHINQKPAAATDIEVNDFVVERKVGDDKAVTRDSIIQWLNGEKDGTAKVIDKLRASTDDNRYMTCLNDVDGTTTKVARSKAKSTSDYTVMFEKNGAWSKDPDATEGAHRFQITTTGTEDYVKGYTATGTYTVVNPGRLQRAVEEACWIKGLGGGNKGTISVPYNGTDYYPAAGWNKNTIAIGAVRDDNGNLLNTSPEYGVDFEVTSVKEEWKNADSYEVTLKGLGGIKDETAVIKVEVARRHINQKRPDLYEKAAGNGWKHGTEIGKSGEYNHENMRGAGENVDRSSCVVEVTAQQGVHTTANIWSDVVVEITDSGLDESVGNNGTVTLVEGVDYEVEEKERTENGEPVKYVEIKGINNYTTELGNGLPDVYREDVEQNKKLMPLNSKRITASVDPATYVIDQRTKNVQLDQSNIILTENAPGQAPKRLADSEFYIVRYEQDGEIYTTEEGITKPGKAYVVVGPTENSKYFNTRKIEFTVTSTDLKSQITIDPIPDETLTATTEYLDGMKMKDHLDQYIVVRYADEQTATFPKDYYTVIVKDQEGNVKATRIADKESGVRTWYVGEYRENSNSNVILTDANKDDVQLKRGDYKVIVESTDYRYEGTAETDFKVIGEDIADGKTFTYTEAFDYTGKAIEPEMTVTTKDGIILEKDRDYTVEYDYNVDAGTGRITVTGIGNYCKTAVRTFTIKQVDGAVAIEATQKAKLESGVDAGGSEVPVVETYVKDEKVDDTKMTYSLSSSDTNVVAIAADGKTMNYVGAGTATITLTPSSTNVKADAITYTVTVNAAAVKEPEAHLTTKHYSTKAKTIGLTTNKIEEATKWQVRYATNKDMSGKYTKTVKTPKRLYHLTLNVKKSKTKYYVRVRAYVNGKWTKWSEKESIKSR